jgi:hypothetical protein
MTDTSAGPATERITVREPLSLLWEADRYPILGDHDAREALALEADAIGKAATAVPSADDPPEFASWLTALRDRSLPNDDREAIMSALYDLFDPEYAVC